MATVLALPLLFERMQFLWAEEGATAQLVFGWRMPAQQTNQGAGRANRVCIVPGSGPAMGSYASARYPGRNPRPLATLQEQATVYVWAYDGSAPNDELAQYTAARLLHDYVVRGIHLSAMADGVDARIQYQISKPEWVRPNLERVMGAELRFTLTVDAMVPDEPWPEAPGGTVTGDVGVKAVFPSGDVDPNPGPVTS